MRHGSIFEVDDGVLEDYYSFLGHAATLVEASGLGLTEGFRIAYSRKPESWNMTVVQLKHDNRRKPSTIHLSNIHVSFFGICFRISCSFPTPTTKLLPVGSEILL